MDYKEIQQECYETLEETLGREPTFQEIDEAFRSYISDLVSAYEN